MSGKSLFIAEWYESDSLAEFEGFMSDVSHTQVGISTLKAAKNISQRNALKHGVMVVGMVAEQQYDRRYGWTTIAEYTCEHFDNEWQEWTKEVRD